MQHVVAQGLECELQRSTYKKHEYSTETALCHKSQERPPYASMNNQHVLCWYYATLAPHDTVCYQIPVDRLHQSLE